MSIETVKTIIKKIIDGDEFRNQFLADTDQALAGYDLTDDERDLFSNIDEDFLNAEDLDERISRWAPYDGDGI